MTITLNHTIVWARDKDAAAHFFAEIFGLRFEGSGGHFAPTTSSRGRGHRIGTRFSKAHRTSARPTHSANHE